MNNMSSVIDFIQTVRFFSSINGRNQLSRIACALDLATFKKDEFVFEEGEIGNHFYIIFEGEVSIVKVKKNNKGQIISKLVLVTLFSGQSFGETALARKDGVRSAGAYCSGKSLSLLSLYIYDYQSIMKEFQADFEKEVYKKFQTITIFKTFNDEVMNEIVKSVVVRNFSADKVLLSKGSTNTQLFLIKQGIVKVLKHVKKPVVDDILKSNPNIPSGGLQDTNLPAGSWALDQNWKSRIKSENVTQGSYTITTVPFVVSLLCTGQVFGELSVLDPGAVSPVDIITLTNVEIYVIDGAKLIALGAKYNVNCMTALNESINLSNPAAEKIDHYFRVKYKWEREKKRVINNIHIKYRNT
jgi:CRP-like cAMP-binding protein